MKRGSTGKQLQDCQSQGRAAGAPGQPRPGHGGAGARAGDRKDKVLPPPGLCVQHHGERHGHHSPRVADGEALPEPPAAEGAP
ncbi:death-associated protein kinase 1 isoform X1 [Prionailurus iriomotensis]